MDNPSHYTSVYQTRRVTEHQKFIKEWYILQSVVVASHMTRVSHHSVHTDSQDTDIKPCNEKGKCEAKVLATLHGLHPFSRG